MPFDAGNYRLLTYAIAPPRKVTLAAVRKDARALKKQAKDAAKAPKPAPPLFSLPGLQSVLNNLLAWLFPPSPGQTPSPPPATPPTGKATTFKVSSFNILGSSHTVGGKGGYAPGTTRIREAAKLLEEKHVDVVGFQELNNDQAIAFKQAYGSEFALYPGNSKRHLASHNSVAWRKDTWDLVKADSVDFPSHLGRAQPSPVVLLKNKQTGQQVYFLNVHNAPGYHKGGAQQQWRDKAVAQQVALINKLKRESGLPVIVTGDMNEKDTVYRRMTQEAGMQAANQGPNGQKPRRMNIDWIFGSRDLKFLGFQRDASSLKRKISDHGMLVSKVRIG